MTWTVEADDDVGRFPPPSRWRRTGSSLEAVTNALRHSGARTCTVSLEREDGMLLVRVRDTGRGLAVERRDGV